MGGLRSITLGTSDLSQTKELFVDILGLIKHEEVEHALLVGDANNSSGTRIQFVELPDNHEVQTHFDSIGLRTPTDLGLEEYENILSEQNIEYTPVKELNGHKYISIKDHNGYVFTIYSNEYNSGVGLGTPSFDSPVNPLHQIQGLGPAIIQSNHLDTTAQILVHIFNLDLFAEYLPYEEASYRVQVFKIGSGGLGGEIHLHQSIEEIQLPEYGAVDQVDFSTDDASAFNAAIQRLNDLELPYQTLKQDDFESIRITENSGLSFVYTLEK